MLELLKGQVAVANKLIAGTNYSSLIRGTFSAVDRDSGSLVCMPERLPGKYLTAENMLVISLADGTVLEGVGQLPRDLLMLLPFLRAYPVVKWIAHSYPSRCSVYSMAGRDLPVYNTLLAGYFTQKIRCTRKLDPSESVIGFDVASGNAVLELAQNMSIKTTGALFVRNDGMLTWGESFDDVLDQINVIEKNAQFAWNVHQLNQDDSSAIPDEFLGRLNEESYYRPLAPGYAGMPGAAVTDKEADRINMDLLINFDQICREHGIRYSLTGGTLLGAVRHGGAIPWDDDVDVFLPRPEYNKLIEAYKDSPRYVFVNKDVDPNYKYMYGRLLDSKTLITEAGWTVTAGMGKFLDVCVVDGLPKGKLRRKLHIAHVRTLFRCRRTLIQNPNKKTYTARGPVITFIKKTLRKLTTVDQWTRLLDKAMQKYPFDSSEYVGNFTSQYGEREMMHRSSFDGYFDLEFNGHKFMVCQGYKEYLTNIFKDYMALPKEASRKGHHPDHAYWV